MGLLMVELVVQLPAPPRPLVLAEELVERDLAAMLMAATAILALAARLSAPEAWGFLLARSGSLAVEIPQSAAAAAAHAGPKFPAPPRPVRVLPENVWVWMRMSGGSGSSVAPGVLSGLGFCR